MSDKISRFLLLGAASALALALPREEAAAQGEVGNAWNITTSVELQSVSAPLLSPDGKLVLFITSHGELSCDCLRSTLYVYRVSDIRQALRKRESARALVPIASMSRRSYGRHLPLAIHAAEWDENSSSIAFIGTDERGIKQVFHYTLGGNGVEQLTRWSEPVQSLMNASGIIVANLLVPANEAAVPSYPVNVVTKESMLRSTAPDQRRFVPKTYIADGTGSQWEVGLVNVDGLSIKPWISADGRSIVMTGEPGRNSNLYRDWQAYDGIGQFSSAGDIVRFGVVDIATRKTEAVFDAPAGTVTLSGRRAEARGLLPRVLGTEMPHCVVLVNTALPITAVDPSRRSQAYVVRYNVLNGRWDIVEPLEEPSKGGAGVNVRYVEIADGGRTISVHHSGSSDPDSVSKYPVAGGACGANPKPSSHDAPPPFVERTTLGDVRFEIWQNAEMPPALVASLGSDRHLILSAPDPALKDVTIRKSVEVSWLEKGGKREAGGLILPHPGSKHVPLIIQIYEYNKRDFAPDGPARHAYAAQTLVQKGFAVLNINLAQAPGTDELESISDRVEKSAQSLIDSGIVDPERIGLIGFSRGGFEAKFLLTKRFRFHIRAAVIDDAYPGTFGYYLASNAAGIGATEFERFYGGTFWDVPERWLKYDFSFNANKVSSAVLLTVHDQSQAMHLLDAVSSLDRLHRPVELLAYPEATHNLVMPRQRYASYASTVDWMEFWLNGQIRSEAVGDSGESEEFLNERFHRWQAMKQIWENQLSWEAAGNPVGSTPH